LRFFDGSGHQLAAQGAAAGSDPTLTATVPTTGTYYVGVSSAGNTAYDPTVAGRGSGGSATGFFYLYGTRASRAGQTLATAQALDLGTDLQTQTLGSVITTNDVELYSVQVNAASTLTLSLDAQGLGSTLQGSLRLFDASGNPVASQDAAAGQ